MMSRFMLNIFIFVALMLALQYAGETANYVFNIIAKFLVLNVAANFITNTIVKE